MYFSSKPVTPESIDSKQYKSLVNYRKKLQKNGLYSSYEDDAEFRRLVQGHFASQMIELLSKHGSTGSTYAEDDVDDQQKQVLRSFIADYNSFMRRLFIDWETERDSNPYNLDEGKYIIDRAQSDLIDFRSMITEGSPKLLEMFNNVIKDAKSLQRHRTYIDGGNSFRAFWEAGNDIMSRISEISSMLEVALDKSNADEA